MKANHIWKIGLAAAVVFVWLAASPPRVYSQSNFDEWDVRTFVTFNEPVRVGGVVLPAGTYMLKVMPLLSNRQVVRVSSADETRVYATVLGSSGYRYTVTDKCEFEFYEATSGAPKALRSWFYHGFRTGIEFAPPRKTA